MTSTREIDLTEVIGSHTRRLRAAGVPTPEVDVRLLAAHVLGESERLAGPAVVDEGSLDRLAHLVQRRAERIPLQHLVGLVWFRHVQLRCEPGVFIPRPETEVVAGLAIDAARTVHEPVVVEPCTGSGAIAASLVAEVPGVTVFATDDSDRAVELARINLARVTSGEAGTEPATGTRWSVHRGDLFAPLDERLAGSVDVVVANPPYLPAADRATWEPEVALHDPVTATVGGTDGHEVVRRLLDESPRWLRDGGVVIVEIDERRGEETAAYASTLGYDGVAIRRDLTGAQRAISATWLGPRKEQP